MLPTPLTLRLLVGEDLDLLPDEVHDRINPTPIPPGTIALPFTHHDGSLDEARFIVAAAAVGVTTDDTRARNTLVDGQARGVVLLWLATAGRTTQDALDLLEPDHYNPHHTIRTRRKSGRETARPTFNGRPRTSRPPEQSLSSTATGLRPRLHLPGTTGSTHQLPPTTS